MIYFYSSWLYEVCIANVIFTNSARTISQSILINSFLINKNVLYSSQNQCI